MKTIQLLFILAISSTVLSAQNYILLSKKDKSFQITEGNTVTIEDNSDFFYKGKLTIVNDSIIKIDNKTFLLNEIAYIRHSNDAIKKNSIIISSIGAVALIASTYFVVYAIAEEESILYFLTSLETFIASASFTKYGVVRLMHGRKFDAKKWHMQVNYIEVAETKEKILAEDQ